jgi:ADP-ribosylglycohydrolase
VVLAVECSRTTHQSPIVLDACRFFAALLLGAMRGESAEVLFAGVYEPVPGLWKQRPLKAEFATALAAPPTTDHHRPRGQPADVVLAVANARAAVAAAGSAEDAIQRAIHVGREPAVEGALAGALGGALWGAAALPGGRLATLTRIEVVERLAARLAERQRGLHAPQGTRE